MLWCSQVAPGNENALRLRVYGEKGGLEWAQEDPNYLWFTPLGEPKRLLTRGGAGAGAEAARVSRTPGGHPEGYLEGFANIYAEAARAIRARRERQAGAEGGDLPDDRGRRRRASPSSRPACARRRATAPGSRPDPRAGAARGWRAARSAAAPASTAARQRAGRRVGHAARSAARRARRRPRRGRRRSATAPAPARGCRPPGRCRPPRRRCRPARPSSAKSA